MLMIFGVIAIAASVLLTATAGLLHKNDSLPEGFRHFVGGQTFGFFLASLMGLGLVMMFAFVVGATSKDPVLIEALVAAAIAVAAYFGVRFIAGRAAAADAPLPLEAFDGLLRAGPKNSAAA